MKRIVILILTVFLVVLTPSSAFAWDYEKYADNQNQPSIPLSWNQNTIDRNIPLSFSATSCAGCGTAAQFGCTQHAMTYLLLKSGTVPKGYSYKDFKADAYKIIQAGGYPGVTRDGLATIGSGGLQRWPGATFDYVKTTTLGTKTVEDSVRELTNLHNQGYLFYFEVPGYRGGFSPGSHWVAMDHIGSDGTIYIMDSSRHTITFPGEVYGGPSFIPDQRWTPEVNRAVLYKMKDGTKPQDLPTIFDLSGVPNPDGTQSRTDGVHGTKVVDGNGDKPGALSDYDLIGMPPLTDGQLTQLELSADPLPSLESDMMALSASAKQNLDSWGNSLEIQKEASSRSMVSGAISFLGLGITLYGLLLLLAFAFDISSPFTIGAFSALTFGKYTPVNVPGGKNSKELNLLQSGGVVFGVIAVGLMLATGVFQSWVVRLVNLLS